VIESILGVIPQHLDRSYIEDRSKLEQFERVTGIKHTWRFNNGSTMDFVKLSFERIKESLQWQDYRSVVFITQSPDRLSPNMAIEFATWAGFNKECIAYDVNRACDGWLLGLQIAGHSPTLIVSVDRLRYRPNPIEGLIFSDSVVFTEWSYDVDETFAVKVKNTHDGSRAHLLSAGLDGRMFMDGQSVFEFATQEVAKQIPQEWVKDCDYFVPHQANLSMIKTLSKRIGAAEKTLYSIEQLGNTSMNSIPLTLAYNKIGPSKVLMCGFGAGLSSICYFLRMTEPIKTRLEYL
jgi:3-oxoacyl-[acyl-carrier-protein] synthase III